jgi:hypothetical protein
MKTLVGRYSLASDQNVAELANWHFTVFIDMYRLAFYYQQDGLTSWYLKPWGNLEHDVSACLAAKRIVQFIASSYKISARRQQAVSLHYLVLLHALTTFL